MSSVSILKIIFLLGETVYDYCDRLFFMRLAVVKKINYSIARNMHVQYAKIEVQVFITNKKDYKDDNDYKHGNIILAQTYVWIDSVKFLEAREWDHKDFEENIKDRLLLSEDPEEVADFFG
ncbi:hypothetical protein Glove_99g150 [Diversispora epigaea]|uniref:Uncharacterized protein n=1 Tax=Diversispora epigaea TaxID=1348612 RepID=A0A397J8L0_9GLOM|nr:hypothetical protein Glove_99g150 [Diversispora epigaea]